VRPLPKLPLRLNLRLRPLNDELCIQEDVHIVDDDDVVVHFLPEYDCDDNGHQDEEEDEGD